MLFFLCIMINCLGIWEELFEYCHPRYTREVGLCRFLVEKRVSNKTGFSIKNMQSLASGKNQVIFSRKKWIFVGYPLTCCFCDHYYNAGLIFGHL